MLSVFRTKPGYTSVEDGEYEGELKLGGRADSSVITIKAGICSALVLTLLVLSSIVSTWILFFGNMLQWQHTTAPAPVIVSTSYSAPSSSQASWVCQQPSTRREWRTLSEPEKNDYINAVQCLATKPSKLRNNGTLYDDFPWVHKRASTYTHKSAPFLPWHRYYIHLYEKALKEDCSFTGDLPYWDWSLDWNNFHAAPVWDSVSGLGGDGDASGAMTVGEGRCVTKGPFSSIKVRYFDGEEHPHCLSRGFPSDGELKELGELIKPEVIEDLMTEPDFDKFASEVERRGHKFLSHSVRGDLSKFTGPNDPVFFLHHTNLDRLWSQWQQTDPAKRLNAYNGKANGNSMEPAQLSDPLDMDGLSRNLMVQNVMETQGGQFCYKY
ncbi:MAG: hypothetical protein Q9157_003177 [Trypethelium eluteriae]